MTAPRQLIDYVLFSNIYIAICATLLAIATQVKFNLAFDYSLLILIFASSLFSYQVHRIVDLKQRPKNNPTPVIKWSYNHAFTINASTFLSAAIILYCIPLLSWYQLIILFFTGLITILYSVPINNKRLRNIGISKIFWVAFVWANVTVLLPLIHSSIPPSTLIYEWFERFIFIFCITIPFDLRDIDFDKKEGLITIPILIGSKKSIQLSVGLIIILAITNLIFHQLTFWQISLFFLLLIPVIQKSFPKKTDYYYTGLVDGTMILYFLFVFLL